MKIIQKQRDINDVKYLYKVYNYEDNFPLIKVTLDSLFSFPSPELFNLHFSVMNYNACKQMENYSRLSNNPNSSAGVPPCYTNFQSESKAVIAFRNMFSFPGVYYKYNDHSKINGGIFYSESDDIPPFIISFYGATFIQVLENHWYYYEIYSN